MTPTRNLEDELYADKKTLFYEAIRIENEGKEINRAISNYRAILQEDDQHIGAWEGLRRTLSKTNLDDALEAMIEGKKKTRNHPQLISSVINILEQQKKYAQAEKEYQTICQLKNEEIKWNLRLYNLQKFDKRKALKVAKEAVKKHPQSTDLKVHLGNIAYETGNKKLAKKTYSTIIGKKTSFSFRWKEYLELILETKDEEELRNFAQKMKSNISVDLPDDFVKRCKEKGFNDETMTKFLFGARHKPENNSMRLGYIEYQESIGWKNTRKYELEIIIRNDPLNEYILYLMLQDKNLTFEERRKYEEQEEIAKKQRKILWNGFYGAKKPYTKISSQEKEDLNKTIQLLKKTINQTEVLKLKSYESLVEIYDYQKNYEQAKRTQQEFMNYLNYPNAERYDTLSKYQYYTGEYKESIESKLEAIDKGLEKKYAWVELAWRYEALGDYKKAKESYEKYIELVPGDIAGYLGLAKLDQQGKL